MPAKIQLEPVDQVRFRIPKDERRGMRAGVLIFASRALLEQVRGDLSLEQAMNVAALPGIVGPSLVMPDVHQGYGFPIGGVAAMDFEHGVVSPGGVGFDINCGVRLARTSLAAGEVRSRMQEIVNQVFRDIPCGTGGAGHVRITPKQLEEVLADGAQWAVKSGYGVDSDIEFCEERGRLAGAGPADVSARAKERGLPQLGTVGSGNHFLEIQYVDSILDSEAARVLDIEQDQVVILIHCGSRGLGHQVCTDYLAEMGAAMKRYGISLPD
ncbi:MAG TPA: RtcB family protein, partial [Bryobacteraceae bacterium]|nr:RtcB family protein [Bryobacteraceae bacterium]